MNIDSNINYIACVWHMYVPRIFEEQHSLIFTLIYTTVSLYVSLAHRYADNKHSARNLTHNTHNQSKKKKHA